MQTSDVATRTTTYDPGGRAVSTRTTTTGSGGVHALGTRSSGRDPIVEAQRVLRRRLRRPHLSPRPHRFSVRRAARPAGPRRCRRAVPRPGGQARAGNRRRAVHWSTTSLGRPRTPPLHTAASLWIAAGVEIKTVSHWLMHSTAELTLDTYGHLIGTDAERAALDRVSRGLGASDARGSESLPCNSRLPRQNRALERINAKCLRKDSNLRQPL